MWELCLISTASLDIRICRTFIDRLRGLLGTEPLTPRQAIWLMPCRTVHTIGMREPLSLLFLDETLKVVKTIDEALPCRAYGCWQAQSVIEMSARPAADLAQVISELELILSQCRAFEDLLVGGIKARIQNTTDQDVERQLQCGSKIQGQAHRD